MGVVRPHKGYHKKSIETFLLTVSISTSEHKVLTGVKKSWSA